MYLFMDGEALACGCRGHLRGLWGGRTGRLGVALYGPEKGLSVDSGKKNPLWEKS